MNGLLFIFILHPCLCASAVNRLRPATHQPPNARLLNMPPVRTRPLIMLSLVCLCTLSLHAQALPAEWQRVAMHPEAAQADPTWGARWLWALYVWRGRLFIGYGSFNGANPRAVIRAFDPRAGRFSAAPVFATDNEALGIFRAINGRLYAPTMDAHDGGLGPQDFAVTTDERGDVWADHAERLMYHTWDVGTRDGKDVWFVGTDASKSCPYNYCSDAVAYRSTDNGQTFTEMKRLPAAANGYRLAWFPMVFGLRGKLYLQAYYRFSAVGRPDLARTESFVFDGRAWSAGPDLLPGRSTGASGYNPVAFAGHIIYLTQVPIARSYPKGLPLWQNRSDLAAFDGHEQVSYLQIPEGVANFAVAGAHLYVLTRAGNIRRTTTLKRPWRSWQTLPAFPIQDPDKQQGCAARSIAVLDGALYVGTTQAELWRLDLANTQPRKPAAGQRNIKQ